MLETWIESGWGPLLYALAMVAVGGLFEVLFARRIAAQCARIAGDPLDVVAQSLLTSALASVPANDNARVVRLDEPYTPAPADSETQPPTSSLVRAAEGPATGVERPAARRGAA